MAAQQMVKQGLRGGRSAGKIVVIGSVLAEVPMPTSSPYNMAKAAIDTRCAGASSSYTPSSLPIG